MTSRSIPYWFAAAAENGHNTALSFLRNGVLETELTFAQLLDNIYRMSNTLLDLGVQKSDRVVLFIPKSVFMVVAHFALQSIGAMVVPLNPGFKKSEMAYLLGDTDARLVIVEPDKAPMISDIQPGVRLLEVDTHTPFQELEFFQSASATKPEIEIKPDDPALMIYTSGTTGNPKGAVLTHKNLVHDARNIINIWEITSRDVLCHALPLFHIHGLCFALHTTLLSGAHVRMLDQFDPDVVLTELSRISGGGVCSVFMAVPAMYTKIIDHMDDQILDFSHLRLLTSGSAPLLIKEFERITTVFGREPVEREGMSETGMNFSNPLNGKRVPGSIGLPLPGLQVKIVDPETFIEVYPGEVGEIWLKGDAITPGYWRKPRETADTFEGGWFRTGDLGRVDAEGYYYLTDRIKHIIISGGENVSAKEVENVINQLQEIQEAVVVGKPDEKWGEKVVAAVMLQPGAEVTKTSVMTFCKEHLHDWKCPKEIIFLNQIPRNAMGKVLKDEVKKIFLT